MSRWEFMRQLEELLLDISPSEREEALQYYNDYFNDAGKENEQEVIKALGSPWQVAKIVRDGLGETAGVGEFTENGFHSGTSANQNAIVKRSADTKESSAGTQGSCSRMDAGGGYSTEQNEESRKMQKQDKEGKQKDKMPTWAIVLIVIGCIFLSPVIIGFAGSALAAIASVIVAIIALVFGIGVATIALYVTAILLIISGFGVIFASPLIATGLIGAGLICGALGILFMMLTVFLAGTCIPGICKGIAYIFGKLFGKKEVA